MTKWKKPLLFAVSMIPIAVAAGVFVWFYELDILSDEAVAEMLAQFGSKGAWVTLGMVQMILYALFFGFFGYILADKTGLWRPIRLEKKKLLATLGVCVPCAVLMSLDYWTFGSVIDGVQAADAAGLTVTGILAAILYGGIIEELMLRLFFLSLIAWLLWKLFFRKYEKERIPARVFVTANVNAAFFFAAGHLPATLSLFGTLTPLILLRCFLLNGGAGLIFGRLYRKYGIVYAMTGHALFHIVSKLIWVIFIG